jgi:hypothetical protein
MKVRVRVDDLRLVLQRDTTLDLCGLQIIERPECLIGDTFVGERPQALDIRCNSGAWDGKKRRWMPSGTTSSLLVCQPA